MSDNSLVEIAIPVYNEESDLETRVLELCRFLESEFPFTARVVIVDNASTDRTFEIAQKITAVEKQVSVIRLEAKGKGLAVYTAWTVSDAEILVYMDLDLSTNLSALHPLVAPLMSGHSDIAIGTRLSRGSHVQRGAKRELISRSYNYLVHASLGTRFTDAHCGFKGIRADAAKKILPFVRDRGWFFDTELLVCAERVGLRIFEVPVDWIDDADSRVNITGAALDDIKGIWRLFGEFITGKIPLNWISESILLPAKTTSFGSVFLRFIISEFVLLSLAAGATISADHWFHGNLRLVIIGVCFLLAEKFLVLRFATGGRHHFLRSSHWVQVLMTGVISLLVIFICRWLFMTGTTFVNASEDGVVVGLFIGGFLRFSVARTWIRDSVSYPNSLEPK